MILDENMIGIMYVNASKGVVSFGSRTKALGTTSLLSYALLAGKEKPMVIDLSTSVIAQERLKNFLRKKGGDTRRMGSW